MKITKRILGALLTCVMLMCMLPIAASAATGTQADPIDAKTKWFGYGANAYLLNPTINEGNAEGIWYTLTVEKDCLLFLEHRQKDVDYTVTMTVNGTTYEGGGTADGVLYNAPLVSLPVKTGDVATIHIATADAAAGTVYANIQMLTGTADDPIKVKSAGIQVSVGAGQTVYYQDDSLQAVYATSGVLLSGNVTDTTFNTVGRNTETGEILLTPFVDSDNDGVIETKLGGSLGGPGAPPVKPAWAIENKSADNRTYTLALTKSAHECNWDNDADANCNTCGAIRELHQHVYDHKYDDSCNTCLEMREATPLPLQVSGVSACPDKNGLAFMITANTQNMDCTENHKAIYDNATIDGYKLVRMGAVMSNNYSLLGRVPNLDDVDGECVLDIPAENLYEVHDDGTVTFAARIINIPDEYKDHEIDILTYVIFKDENDVEHILYCNSIYYSYNQAVNQAAG